MGMPISLYLNRAAGYCSRHGFFQTVLHFFVMAWRSLIPQAVVVYTVDLKRMPDADAAGEKITVELKTSMEEISEEELRQLFLHRNEATAMFQLEERFNKGALLWSAKIGQTTVGMVWSIRNLPVKQHYFPLANENAHLFDNEIFAEFRGKGLNPVLINLVLRELKKMGLVHAYIETAVWNRPEISSLAKTHFIPVCTARKISLFGRNITVWEKVEASA